jgi:hypothetical protein
MRAFLIDATIRTVVQFDFIHGRHMLTEIIGGPMALASGPLTPTLDDSVYKDGYGDMEENAHLADYLYAADGLHFAGNDFEGDPKSWFQIDADREQATFPIPGRGVVLGISIDGTECDAQLTLEELTARVTFTRRKLRGTTTRTGIMPGETWTGPRAPIIDGD